MVALKPMGDERHEGAQSHEHRRSSGNGSARPLPLGLHAKMGADFLERDFHPPALDEPKAEKPRSTTTLSRAGAAGAARDAKLGAPARSADDVPAQLDMATLGRA